MLRKAEWKQYRRADCGIPWAAFWGSLVQFLALLPPSPVTLEKSLSLLSLSSTQV